MIRIVIINDASVARGGATSLAKKQAQMLVERGHEVIYAAGDSDPGEAIFPNHTIALRHAGGAALLKMNKLAAATRGFYSGAARDMVAALVATDTPETIYHVHSFAKALTPSIFSPLRRVAPRVFVHAHDFFLACPNGGFMDYNHMLPCERVPLSLDCLSTQCDKRNYAQKLWRSARQATLRQTLPRTAPWGGIILIHPAMRAYFERSGYPPHLLHTVRNPAQALSARRVPAEKNTQFFFIGRLEPEKGIEELLRAAAAAQLPLSVIGTGPLLEPLKAAYPKVTFHGWMDREAIGRVIGDARALVMPTRYPEPFGLVAAEASLSGLPVILSRQALLGPEMDAKGIGITCTPHDIGNFAAALKRVAEMPEPDIAAMSHAAASGQAGLCTSPEDWIDGQLALFEQALDGQNLDRRQAI
ncbi:MAG: glycosyltransferase family 4 protein [Pseudomonadota bacterium]